MGQHGAAAVNYVALVCFCSTQSAGAVLHISSDGMALAGTLSSLSLPLPHDPLVADNSAGCERMRSVIAIRLRCVARMASAIALYVHTRCLDLTISPSLREQLLQLDRLALYALENVLQLYPGQARSYRCHWRHDGPRSGRRESRHAILHRGLQGTPLTQKRVGTRVPR
jgi:hypothetical protein